MPRSKRRYPPDCCSCYRAARSSFAVAMFIFLLADLVVFWFLLDWMTPALPEEGVKWVVFLAAQIAAMIAPVTWLMWREFSETRKRALTLCCEPATPDCSTCTFKHSSK